jgi:hypothetical protein
MREIETNLNQDSLAATNISFLLSFEKWIGCRDFLSLITPSLTNIKKVHIFSFSSSHKSHPSSKS